MLSQVLGVSKDPFIVYTSNVFAIMGLRSLYTLVARAVTGAKVSELFKPRTYAMCSSDLPFLRPAVALVLAFVGGKMILEYFHYEVSLSSYKYSSP
jgi:predicted tellurium resistance membrane protein TerC